MNYISLNIRHLFNNQDLSEVEYGGLFGLKRGAIQSYISGKATPKIETLQKITVRYGFTLDEFVNSDISKLGKQESESKQYPPEEQVNISSEPKITTYTCPDCIKKQKEVDIWKGKFYALCDESREVERKYRELLEEKIEIKKETPTATDAQAG